MEWTSRLLTAEQFERLRGDPKGLLARADARITEVTQEKERLLSQSVVDKLNTEQAVNTLEQHYIAVKRELEAVHEHYQKLRTENETHLTSFDQLSAENQRLKQRITDLESSQYQVSRGTDEVHAEKRQILAMVERKDSEMKRLAQEVHELSERNAKLGTEKLDLQRRVNELDTSSMQSQFEVTRLSREKQHLEQQFQWASGELDVKAKEVAEARKEKSSQVMALRMQLDEVLEARRLGDEQVTTLRARCSEIERQKGIASDKLKGVRDELSLQAEQFRRELAAKDSLVELLKSNADEYQAKLKDAQQIVDGTKSLLAQEKERAQAVVHQAEDKVNKLVQENADLTKELEVLSSRLAAAPMAIPISPTTRPLELQMRYEETSRALQAEKSENRRLSNYLNQILKEIEDKAPLIQEQRVEYEKTLRRNERLASNLETAMSEIDALRTERATVTEEKKTLQREAEDLSRQVQLLLREVQLMREKAGEPRWGDELRAAVPPPLVDMGGELVPEHLIAFTSIQQLQQNNQELLRMIHKLQDERQREAGLERAAELIAVKQELAKLKEQRNQAEVLMQGIVRQRDMYRALAQARDQETVSMQPVLQAEPPMDSNRLLRDLQEEFDRYRKERTEYERDLNTKLLSSTDSSSDLRVQLAKATTQLELNHDRYTLLQGSLESHKRENEALRAKNSEYSNSVIEHQRRVEEFRQEMLISKEKQRQLEVQVSNLRVEKEVLQSSEKRALAERTSVAAERDRMQSLLDNLQNLLLTKESSEADLRRKLMADVSSSKEDLTTVKQQLEETRAERERERTDFDSRHRHLALLVEAKEKQASDVREQLIKSTADYEALSAQLRDTRAQLAKAEASLEMLMRTTVSGDKAKDNESAEKRASFELSQARVELVNVKESLMMEQQNLAHYKEIAATYETQLKDTSKAFDEFRVHNEAQVTSLSAERDRSHKRMAELESLVQQYQSDQEVLEKKLREQISATEIAKRNTEAVEQQLKAAHEKVEEVQRNVGVRSDLLQEAQANYERELLAHAKDVEALNNNSRDKEQLRAALEEAKQKLASEMSAHTSAVGTAAEVRASLERQLQVQEQRIADLDKQNSLLHQQVERVNGELRKVQSSASNSNVSTSLDAADASNQLNELRELLHMTRLEKDIANARVESSRQEAVRLKQQLDHALRSLDEARALAHASEERLNKENESAAQHQAAVAQLQQLNLLRESNVTLRDENEKALRKIRDLQEKLAEVEARVQPLNDERAHLAALRDALQIEKGALETENGRWRMRVQQLIDRQQRVDPEQHEKLQEECKAQTEKANTLAAQVAKIEAEFSAAKEEQSKAAEEKNKLVADQQSLKDQMNRAMNALRTNKAQLAALTKEKEDAQAEVKRVAEELEKTRSEGVESRTATESKESESQKRSQTLETELKALKEKEQKIKALAGEATKKVRELTSQNAALLQEVKSVKEQVTQLQSAAATTTAPAQGDETMEGTLTPLPTESPAPTPVPTPVPAAAPPATIAKGVSDFIQSVVSSTGGKRKQPEEQSAPSPAEEASADPVQPPPAAAFVAPTAPAGVISLAKRTATSTPYPNPGLSFGLTAPPSPQPQASRESAGDAESLAESVEDPVPSLAQQPTEVFQSSVSTSDLTTAEAATPAAATPASADPTAQLATPTAPAHVVRLGRTARFDGPAPKGKNPAAVAPASVAGGALAAPPPAKATKGKQLTIRPRNANTPVPAPALISSAPPAAAATEALPTASETPVAAPAIAVPTPAPSLVPVPSVAPPAPKGKKVKLLVKRPMPTEAQQVPPKRAHTDEEPTPLPPVVAEEPGEAAPAAGAEDVALDDNQ